MKCLVTGGLGYIGSHFVLEAIKAGIEPVIVDNLCNSSIEVLHKLEHLCKRKISFYSVDLLDKSALEKIFLNESFNFIVHFAGLKSVSDSTSTPLRYYENNVIGSLNLLELMKAHHVDNIIFSSSATVYGHSKNIPYVESHQKNPMNPYGKSKSMVEDMLEDFCLSDDNISAISLRYFNPIGAEASGLLGDSPSGVPNNLLPYITRVAKGLYDALKIYGNDYDTIDGTGVRDYIHVMDLIAGHLEALQYQKTHQGYEVFNLGCGKGVSVLEMVDVFEKINNRHIPRIITARRAGDLAEYWACSNKAKSLLNWEAKYSVEDMVRDAWHFEQKNITHIDKA